MTRLNQEDQSVGALPTSGEFYGGGSCFVIERILKISRSILRESHHEYNMSWNQYSFSLYWHVILQNNSLFVLIRKENDKTM